MLSFKGLNSDYKEKFISLCSANLYCRSILRMVGNWDFIVTTAFLDISGVKEFTKLLNNTFEDELSKIEIIPIVNLHKIYQYPLSDNDFKE